MKIASTDSKRLKVKITVSVQLQRAIWDLAYVKRDLFNVITYHMKSWTHIAEQASICVYKTYTFFLNDRSFR